MKHLRNKLLLIISIVIAQYAYAMRINPMDHTSLINDNDQKNKTAVDESNYDADPYYILSGESDQALAQGDYVTAILRIREALSIQPDNPSNVLLLSNLGIAYGMLDQDSLALKTYNDALAIAPSMTTVLLNRALLKIKMGRDNEAMNDFDLVIDKDSTNCTARYYRGMMSLFGGDLLKATNDFAVLESTAPDTYETWAAMSTLYSLTQEDAKAIPYYEKLIEVDPSPEYYSALAGCYIATDQLSSASALLAKGIREYPEDGELYLYRAWLYKKYLRFDESDADAKRAIERGIAKSKVESILKR